MYEIVKIAVEVAFVAIVAYAIYSAVKKKKNDHRHGPGVCPGPLPVCLLRTAVCPPHSPPGPDSPRTARSSVFPHHKPQTTRYPSPSSGHTGT